MNACFYFCSLLVNGMMIQSVLRTHDKRLVYPVESDIHSTYKRTNLKRKTYEVKGKEKEWKRGKMYQGWLRPFRRSLDYCHPALDT